MNYFFTLPHLFFKSSLEWKFIIARLIADVFFKSDYPFIILLFPSKIYGILHRIDLPFDLFGIHKSQYLAVYIALFYVRKLHFLHDFAYLKGDLIQEIEFRLFRQKNGYLRRGKRFNRISAQKLVPVIILRTGHFS